MTAHQDVNKDTENAKRGIVPPHAVDGYTSFGVKVNPPAQALFDRGSTSPGDAGQGQAARREHTEKLGGTR
jgi:hypothetical protein